MNFVPPGKVRMTAPEGVEYSLMSLSSVILVGMGSGDSVRNGTGEDAGEYAGEESCEWMVGNVECGDGCLSGYWRPRMACRSNRTLEVESDVVRDTGTGEVVEEVVERTLGPGEDTCRMPTCPALACLSSLESDSQSSTDPACIQPCTPPNFILGRLISCGRVLSWVWFRPNMEAIRVLHDLRAEGSEWVDSCISDVLW